MQPVSRQPQRNLDRLVARDRSAFTLVELLVVITITLILIAATVASVNFSINADKVRSGARQFQSFLAGARDRAIQANDIRGVRLLLDPNDNHAVGAVQYIGSPSQDLIGKVAAYAPDTQFRTVSLVPSSSNHWALLQNRGVLKVGSRIQIPQVTGLWYTVTAIKPDPTSTAPGGGPMLVLNQQVTALAAAVPPGPGVTPSIPHALELSPAPLGDAQPVLFPRGVVIDLDGSSVPFSWRPASITAPYGSPTPMDILFSPQGNIIGDCASAGMVHLHFADSFDVNKWHTEVNTNTGVNGLVGRTSGTGNYIVKNLPIVPADIPASPPSCPTATTVVTRDRVLATLTAKTGQVGVYYVYPQNTNGCGSNTCVAYDPYRYAETGQVANR